MQGLRDCVDEVNALMAGYREDVALAAVSTDGEVAVLTAVYRVLFRSCLFRHGHSPESFMAALEGVVGTGGGPRELPPTSWLAFGPDDGSSTEAA